MKTIEKLSYINEKLKKLQKRLEKRKFKAEFKNFGANKYCLVMKEKTYKFNTYDDLISCLNFIDDMFENAREEIEKEKK